MGEHINPVISQVKLPNGTIYDVHDSAAIHSFAELGVELVQFGGTVAKVTDLPTASKTYAGFIYHVIEDETEYICVTDTAGGTTYHWESFGEKFIVNHIHNVTGTYSGTTNDTTIKSASTTGKAITSVTSTPIITKATAAGTAVGANGTDTFVKSYPGASEKLVTTTVNSAGADVSVSKVSKSTSKLSTTAIKGVKGTESVIKTVTPTTATVTSATITGVSGSTTASKATAGTAVAVAKAGTAKSIPNVTGNTSVTASKVSNLSQKTIPNVTGNTSVTASKVKTAGSNGTKGTAASWGATVENEVLSFSWTANTPTVPSTIPTFDSVSATNTTLGTAISATYLTATDVTATNTTLGTAISVTPAESNGSIVPYTMTDVTVPIADSAATYVAELAAPTDVVVGIGTTSATVAVAADSNTTVATGSTASNGGGATVVTSVTTTDVTAAGPATAVTVATGQTAADGAGKSVLVGLGTPTTKSALTGVKVTAQPTITLEAGTEGTAGHFKTGETVSSSSANLAVTGTVNGAQYSGSLANGVTTAPLTPPTEY